VAQVVNGRGTAGPTSGPTTRQLNGSPPCQASSPPTMATNRMAAWAATHRTAGSPRQQPR